jgi:hypothetical protein
MYLLLRTSLYDATSTNLLVAEVFILEGVLTTTYLYSKVAFFKESYWRE